MLKGVKKGLKKKIKGEKKKDKGEDLFDEKNLAKYKKELEEKKRKELEELELEAQAQGVDVEELAEQHHQQQHQNQHHQNQQHHHQDNYEEDKGAAEEDDEWKKFKLLTSGVDDILKKTTGELDRIKADSYYQRKAPRPDFAESPANLQAQREREKERFSEGFGGEASTSAGAANHQESSHSGEGTQRKKKKKGWKGFEEGAGESEESEPEAEDHPQDQAEPEPEDEEPKLPEYVEEEPIVLDDDLFDTDYLDAIESGEIKLAYIPESPDEQPDDGDDPFAISSDVQDVVKRIEEAEKLAKRQVNLGSAVNFYSGKKEEDSAETTGKKSGPVVLTKEQKQGRRARPRPHAINLLGDESNTTVKPSESETSAGEPGEPPVDIVVEAEKDIFDVLDDTLVVEKPQGSSEASGEEQVGEGEEKDTLDIFSGGPSLVAQLTPSPVCETPRKSEDNSKSDKSSDLKDFLSEFDTLGDSDLGIDPSVPDSKLLFAPSQAELDEVDDEFEALAAESILKNKPPTPEEDPFDTKWTADDEVEVEVTEEKEKEKDKVESDDDFDFNPREGEEEDVFVVKQGDVLALALSKDLLGGSCTDLSDIGLSSEPKQKPIEPQTEPESPSKLHISDDPFEVHPSLIEKIGIFGKGELKLLEEELLALPGEIPTSILPPSLKSENQQQQQQGGPNQSDNSGLGKGQSVESDDFNPRSGEPPKVVEEEPHPFDVEESVQIHQVLTPQQAETELDPFDTSAADVLIIPGKAEIQYLESEFNPEGQKQQAESVVELEVTRRRRSSLVGTAEEKPAQELDEFEFNPRAAFEESLALEAEKLSEDIDQRKQDIFDSEIDLPTFEKPLSPTCKTDPNEIDDPFNTEHCESLVPGPAELKVLENELLSYTQDFQPPNQLLPNKKPADQAQQAHSSPQKQFPVSFGESETPGPAVVHQPPPRPPPPPVSLLDEHIDPEHQEDDHPAPILPKTLLAQRSTSLDDPFNTDKILGDKFLGKTELKLLEEELISKNPSGSALDDYDFDPRGQAPISAIPAQPLVPQQASLSEADPFDTSIAEGIIPGKTELRIIEAEFLQ